MSELVNLAQVRLARACFTLADEEQIFTNINKARETLCDLVAQYKSDIIVFEKTISRYEELLEKARHRVNSAEAVIADLEVS